MKWEGLLRRRVGLTCHECDRDVVLAGRGTANLVSALITFGGAVSFAKLASHIETRRGVEFSAVGNAVFVAVGIALLIGLIQFVPPFFLRARKPSALEDVDMQK